MRGELNLIRVLGIGNESNKWQIPKLYAYIWVRVRVNSNYEIDITLKMLRIELTQLKG